MTGSRRLLNRDYSSAGLYFVTICSNFKRCTFGEVEHGGARLSDLGKIVEEAWTGLAHRTLNVRLHGHVVMPNHVHGIIEIVRGAQQAAPLQGGEYSGQKSCRVLSLSVMYGHSRPMLRGGRGWN